MKKHILNIILAIIAVSCFSVGIVDANSKTERIEQLYYSKIDDWNWVRVFHDTSFGIEYICTYISTNGGANISCVATGRNWK